MKKIKDIINNIKLSINERYLVFFRNKHLGERCFILGNGPSLCLEDLNKLKWEYTFASNKIYLIFKQTEWRPTYYVVEDILILEQNYKIINNLNRMTKFFPHFFINILGCKQNNFYFNVPDTPYIHELWKNKSFPNFSYDATECIYWGSTVVYSQIQLAIFMGFKEIYLLGLDHLYFCPTKKVENYYICEGEQNHFHKDYRKIGEKWHQPQLDILERSYAKALESCKKIGVTILNVSKKTQLDIFPKCSLSDILRN